MRYVFFLFFLLVNISLLSGQTNRERAKELMGYGKYSDALSLLTNTSSFDKHTEEERFLIAVCHYQLNNLDASEQWLKQLIDSEKSTYPECWLYLGRIFHHRHQFAEAAAYYKNYLRGIRAGHPQRQMVVDAIKRCANGLVLQYQKNLAYVENLGQQVNTKQDEFAPILSPNDYDRLYFSSVRVGNMGGPRDRFGRPDDQLGQYKSDMFSCINERGQWGGVRAMHFLLNSPQHEVLLDFNFDGSVLLYYKGNTFTDGRILIDTFQRVEERSLRSDPFLGPINFALGDQEPYFFNDTLVIFASKRLGGYGGFDLYRSSRSNGRWNTPVNLGPDINSAYDEMSPFMALNGRTIYFSSNHPDRSIGGLDVFKSTYLPSMSRWTKPFNLGLPINSAGDDAHFRLAKDGFSAYFSSSRKDGYGQRDIYAAYFEDFLPEQEVVVSFQPTTQEIPDVPTNPAPSIIEEPVVEPPSVPAAATASASANAPTFAMYSNDNFQTLDVELLQKIQARLNDFKGLKLVISAYDSTPDIGDRLFDAILLAEAAADWFFAKGIDKDRLFLRALPVLPDSPDGSRQALSFSFFSEDDTITDIPILGRDKSPLAPDHLLNSDLFFKVQFVSVRKKYANDAINETLVPMIEVNPEVGYYRYTLGAFDRFAEADQLRKEIAKKGFSSAFVVPYIQAMRADKYMVKRALGDYPELENYLNQ